MKQLGTQTQRTAAMEANKLDALRLDQSPPSPLSLLLFQTRAVLKQGEAYGRTTEKAHSLGELKMDAGRAGL